MTFARANRSSSQRGYGYDHRQARRRAIATMQDGDPCSRCGGPMYHGQALHLDHSDDRGDYLGLSHGHCNVVAGARKGNRITNGTSGSYPLRVK